LQRTAALKLRAQFARHRTGLITTPLPSAAFVATAARIAPGDGSLSVVPACRQVTHTYTVAALADASMSVSDDCSEPTRAAPQGRRPNPGAWCEATDPEAPRRATTESTAGLLARGSPPVTAFPGLGPSGNVARARRLQLRGQLRLLEHWFRTAFPVRSRVRDRRLQPVNGCGARFVNGDAPLCLRSILREL